MSTDAVSEKENRRIQRVALPLPTRIEVKVDQTVSWTEITRLGDVSAYGAGFQLKRPVKRGRLLLVTTPMPRQLRCYDHNEPQYKIWGIVRRCLPVRTLAGEELYVIGAAFIGRNPPADYFQNPAKLYEISHRETHGLWHVVEAQLDADQEGLPRDTRRQTRFFIPETITIEPLDDNGNITGSETSVTENLSLGGASVFTSLPVKHGSFVRVTSERYGVTLISIVRGKRLGPDGLPRLHLEFIDKFFPLEGIE